MELLLLLWWLWLWWWRPWDDHNDRKIDGGRMRKGRGEEAPQECSRKPPPSCCLTGLRVVARSTYAAAANRWWRWEVTLTVLHSRALCRRPLVLRLNTSRPELSFLVYKKNSFVLLAPAFLKQLLERAYLVEAPSPTHPEPSNTSPSPIPPWSFLHSMRNPALFQRWRSSTVWCCWWRQRPTRLKPFLGGDTKCDFNEGLIVCRSLSNIIKLW